MTRMSGEVALGLAWFMALVASLAVLFFGEVLGQTPCVLCWFQRAFMFPLAVILGIASYRSDPSVSFYALTLAIIGGLIAAYHSALFAGLITAPITPCLQSGPSCTDDNMMIFGGVPLPLLSLGAFATIALILIAINRRTTQ